jgi:hypothetical protein
MNTISAIGNIVIAGMATCFLSCSNHYNKSDVEKAMQQYDHLIKKMDVDSIALLYSPDGDLGSMAHGRDSIKNFLLTFKNFEVLSQSSITNSVDIKKDSTVQKGTYRQIVVTPKHDTVTVKGEFTATWQWIPHDGLHIKRMMTKPIN